MILKAEPVLLMRQLALLEKLGMNQQLSVAQSIGVSRDGMSSIIVTEYFL